MFLRHPEEGDFEELSELFRVSKGHLAGFVSQNFDRDRFTSMLNDARTESNEYFVVCRASDGMIVGTLNLSQIFRRSFQNAYLGYMLGVAFTGRGYMTEAVHLALRYAFEDLKLHRVEANVQPHNLPSIGVLVRAGFTKEGFSRRYLKIGGRWRDHERWAIIREDWIINRKNGRDRT